MYLSRHFDGPSEVILCDFTSGVSVVSLTNLVSWKVVPPFWRK